MSLLDVSCKINLSKRTNDYSNIHLFFIQFAAYFESFKDVFSVAPKHQDLFTMLVPVQTLRNATAEI